MSHDLSQQIIIGSFDLIQTETDRLPEGSNSVGVGTLKKLKGYLSPPSFIFNFYPHTFHFLTNHLNLTKYFK